MDPRSKSLLALQQDSEIGDYYSCPDNGSQFYGNNVSDIEDYSVRLGEEAGNCMDFHPGESGVDFYPNINQPLHVETGESVVDSYYSPISQSDCYPTISQPVKPVDGGDVVCDYCDRCCQCDLYGGCSSLMLPGDVYYYSSNSFVLCVKQNKSEKQLYSPPQQVQYFWQTHEFINEDILGWGDFFFCFHFFAP